MKLLITIIQDRDRQSVADALSEGGYFFTKIASTGGFLRDGNVTLLLGVEDDQLDHVLDLLKSNSTARDQYVSMPPPDVMPGANLLQSPVSVRVGGAVCFIMNVESFERW